MAKKKTKRMTRNERIIEAINAIGEDREISILLLGNPPECVEAIVGLAYRGDEVNVVYSESKYILGLMKENNWSMDEAREWFEFNTVRGLEYMGDVKNKPIFIDTDFPDCI